MAAHLGSPEDLLSCQPGDRILDWYDGQDMWHERILIRKGRADAGWYVLTQDLDLYEQSYSLKGDDGPVKLKVKGRHFSYYPRLSAPVFKFVSEPSEADMRGYIETNPDELGLETVPSDGWRPSEVKVARRKISISACLVVLQRAEA